jgi:AraC family transcriptional regulator
LILINYSNKAVVVIDSQRLQQLATENDCLYADRLELQPILLSRDPQLEVIATSFRREMFNNELGGKLYTESLANLFLIHLLRKYCTQTFTLRSCEEGLSRYQLQYALEFIHANLNGEFRLQDLAELLGMSQYYFCRLFKQSTGTSPYQYVLQQRVKRVKSLLSTQPKKAIADISLECGFSSQSQMTQHFRKLTGTTPRAYRRN